MDLKRKLALLRSAGPGSRAADDSSAPPAETDAPTAMPSDGVDAARLARIAELRGRIHTMMARPTLAGRPVVQRAVATEALPFAASPHAEGGTVHARVRTYDSTQRHGLVPLHVALEARGETIATLALDPALRSFDPSRALYLDTETTGLSGGTGTLAFLIGLGSFEGRSFRVEQLFLSEPCDERAMLATLAERIEAASALVTFNGKAFDMPLLRSRFVMARLSAPREPPHLDLVHASRRVYGARLDQCKLTTIERDVLGFVREGDVPSGEIPARYATFLRGGDPAQLLSVIEHNLWDVIAMAALAGELGARMAGGDALGRCEPADIAALARTALRAGAPGLAVTLAADAAAQGVRQGQPEIAVRAHRLAAGVQRTRRDHHGQLRSLLDAPALAPDDSHVHLALAKLYEHRLRDPALAFEHAIRAIGAEEPDASHRRHRRLQKRLARRSLPLVFPPQPPSAFTTPPSGSATRTT